MIFLLFFNLFNFFKYNMALYMPLGDAESDESSDDEGVSKIYRKRSDILDSMSNEDLYKRFRFDREGIMVCLIMMKNEMMKKI